MPKLPKQNKLKPLKFILISLTFLTACQKEYNPETCQKIVFRAYKGSPQAEVERKKNCLNIKVKISKQKCQKALEKLILKGSPKILKEDFGPEIMNCFSENDLANFVRE